MPPHVNVKCDRVTVNVCACACVMRSLLSMVRVQLLRNPFWLSVHCLRSGGSDPPFKEKVSLLSPATLSILPSLGSFISHSCRSHPPLPSASFSLVCNSFTVFSFLILPPSLPLFLSLFFFFVKFCIQTPLYSSSPDSTLSPALFFFLYSSLSFHPPPPLTITASPSCPSLLFTSAFQKKRLKKKKKNFHRWFYLNTSTNEV